MRPRIYIIIGLWLANGVAAVWSINVGLRATQAVGKYQQLKAEVSAMIVQAAKADAIYTLRQEAVSRGYTNGTFVYIPPGS